MAPVIRHDRPPRNMREPLVEGESTADRRLRFSRVRKAISREDPAVRDADNIGRKRRHIAAKARGGGDGGIGGGSRVAGCAMHSTTQRMAPLATAAAALTEHGHEVATRAPVSVAPRGPELRWWSPPSALQHQPPPLPVPPPPQEWAWRSVDPPQQPQQLLALPLLPPPQQQQQLLQHQQLQQHHHHQQQQRHHHHHHQQPAPWAPWSQQQPPWPWPFPPVFAQRSSPQQHPLPLLVLPSAPSQHQPPPLSSHPHHSVSEPFEEETRRLHESERKRRHEFQPHAPQRVAGAADGDGAALASAVVGAAEVATLLDGRLDRRGGGSGVLVAAHHPRDGGDPRHHNARYGESMYDDTMQTARALALPRHPLQPGGGSRLPSPPPPPAAPCADPPPTGALTESRRSLPPGSPGPPAATGGGGGGGGSDDGADDGFRHPHLPHPPSHRGTPAGSPAAPPTPHPGLGDAAPSPPAALAFDGQAATSERRRSRRIAQYATATASEERGGTAGTATSTPPPSQHTATPPVQKGEPTMTDEEKKALLQNTEQHVKKHWDVKTPTDADVGADGHLAFHPWTLGVASRALLAGCVPLRDRREQTPTLAAKNKAAATAAVAAAAATAVVTTEAPAAATATATATAVAGAKVCSHRPKARTAADGAGATGTDGPLARGEMRACHYPIVALSAAVFLGASRGGVVLGHYSGGCGRLEVLNPAHNRLALALGVRRAESFARFAGHYRDAMHMVLCPNYLLEASLVRVRMRLTTVGIRKSREDRRM